MKKIYILIITIIVIFGSITFINNEIPNVFEWEPFERGVLLIVLFFLLLMTMSSSESKESPKHKINIVINNTTSDEALRDACLSYRHDFGLLSKEEQEKLLFQAKEWDIALRKAKK